VLVAESIPQVKIADDVDFVSFGCEVKVTIGVDTTVVGLSSVIDYCVNVLGDLEVIIVIPVDFILVDDTSCAEGPVYDV